MFLLLGDGEYLALGNGPPARLLLGEEFPNGTLDISGVQEVSSKPLHFASEPAVLGMSNDTIQVVEDLP